jgi:hypothetical protein
MRPHFGVWMAGGYSEGVIEFCLREEWQRQEKIRY